jgi:hypothetical protein
MCDEKFGFRLKHSTSLQLTSLSKVTRYFGEKRKTSNVLLDVNMSYLEKSMSP